MYRRNVLATWGACIALLVGARCVRAQYVLTVDRNTAVPSFVGYVPDEIILVLDEAVDPLDVEVSPSGRSLRGVAGFDDLAKTFATIRIKKQFPQRTIGNATSVVQKTLARHYKVKFSRGSLEQALEAYGAHPLVDHVEPIGIHSVTLTPNDTYYQNSPSPSFPYDQWHYWDTAGVDADLAWDIEAGDPNVIVAVLDTGVRYFHKDLGGDNPVWGPDNPTAGGNIWINSAEIAGNGIDDDGNGKIDDTIGWDFVSSAGGGGVSCQDQDCGTVDCVNLYIGNTLNRAHG